MLRLFLAAPLDQDPSNGMTSAHESLGGLLLVNYLSIFPSPEAYHNCIPGVRAA
jgi:hypothetical protein